MSRVRLGHVTRCQGDIRSIRVQTSPMCGMAEDKQSSVPISGGAASYTAPTPVNTPLNAAPISLGLSRPTVPDISEDEAEQQQGHDLINKLQNLNIRPSGVVEVLPAPVSRRVEGLKGVHAEYCKIEHELKREMLELEKKVSSNFVSGPTQADPILGLPTPEEIAAGEAVSEKDDPEAAATAKLEREEAEKNLSIPHFWLTVLRNHDGLSDLITEKDEAALEYLTDIRLVYLSEATPGFKLIFDFAPNPYFENETLEKSYHYQDELGDTGDYIYDRAVGSEIKWKEDKDLTKAIEIKKQRNKTTNRTRLIRRSHSVPSFFNFFSPPAQPTPEQIENGEVDEELLEELDEKLELDYQIGEDLKERVRPVSPCSSLPNQPTPTYDIAGIEDDDDYEDMDEDDYEDSFDAGPGASPSRRGKQGNEECKQQ
ncbi:nucleosome assembly protein I [Rhizoctonia solani AG-1 IA]|uniref:Nucleosome assembly protein I n=1 Tax=Thanatephorus cucumeris (strain AG1-IA) TaxID=983506 RepID=L8WS50_THACA|nr:nucleosome assembly protein I [Rhizoctonia solani AG-1 IA]